MAANEGLPMLCPPVRLCMDNGIMVAWTGMQRLRLGLVDQPISAEADEELVGLFVEVRPKWPLGPRDSRSRTQQEQLSKRKTGPLPQPPPKKKQKPRAAPAEVPAGEAALPKTD